MEETKQWIQQLNFGPSICITWKEKQAEKVS